MGSGRDRPLLGGCASGRSVEFMKASIYWLNGDYLKDSNILLQFPGESKIDLTSLKYVCVWLCNAIWDINPFSCMSVKPGVYFKNSSSQPKPDQS